jgi:hypothetical protein
MNTTISCMICTRFIVVVLTVYRLIHTDTNRHPLVDNILNCLSEICGFDGLFWRLL